MRDLTHTRITTGVWNLFPVKVVLPGLLLVALATLSACSFIGTERLVYDQQDIRIGVEADPTLARSGRLVLNNHPAVLTPKEIESLLQVIQVSGWSGTLVGMLGTPPPVALFTLKELSTISKHLSNAFQSAKPTERLFFSLPKPDVTYSDDRTTGALFLRGRYLHVIVTDHSSLIQSDTGGGEFKDLRDTKGMKLWVAGPAEPAMVPDLEEPRWAPFERVHLSLNAKEILAQQGKSSSIRTNQGGASPPSSMPASFLPKGQETGASAEVLQSEVGSSDRANSDLRIRLDEQNTRIEQMNEQLKQLRLDLDKAKSRRQPSRKLPTP